ncbi:MAG: histidine--tRNA ligase [bacterium]
MSENTNKLSTDPYKGVRDFYPEDQSAENYIFNIWRKTCESFGFVEYNASPLEPSELYKAKTGEEIVNEQTYSFVDRGGREVTLRPEMTPTVARMIAGKKRELSFPVRWFSIPNMFRYERPQRGRLREHFQLNCDTFGLDNIYADIEIIRLAYQIMINFGAKETDFEVRLSNRTLLNKTLSDMGLSSEQSHDFQKLLDRKKKIDNFDEEAERIVGKKIDWKLEADEEMQLLISELKNAGISNVKFDDTIVRGFDYYTGTVFEIYDTNPENSRALFGGGRYDDLLSLFGNDKVSAIGFGMGDVTIRDFLETRNILPKYESSTKVYIGTFSKDYVEDADVLAKILRGKKINVAIDYTGRKIVDQIKKADKEKINFFIAIGEHELETKSYNIKNLFTGEENICSLIEIEQFATRIFSNT